MIEPGSLHQATQFFAALTLNPLPMIACRCNLGCDALHAIATSITICVLIFDTTVNVIA